MKWIDTGVQPEQGGSSVFFTFYVPKYLFIFTREDMDPENIRYYGKES